jgi:hypothetical protein
MIARNPLRIFEGDGSGSYWYLYASMDKMAWRIGQVDVQLKGSR